MWVKWPFWPNCPQFWPVLDGRKRSKQVLSIFFPFWPEETGFGRQKPNPVTDLPTLPHWAEAFRISRPASDLPHFHKIFRFQLKSDQHVFPVWIAMQLTWLSTSYHDHSSLSCPLISWGSVKTETLPALCNKNNKPIDLIHLRCGWQLTLLRKGRAYMVSQENAPHQTLCLTENVSFPNTYTLQTQTGTKIVTLKCLKKGKWNCMPQTCHKNISWKNGFVFKNDKHMVIWHLNMAVDARLRFN